MSLPRELDRLRVVLVSTRNPLNIGAAARAMSNFGCSHLRVVNPFERAFREARSAVGGAAVLANAEEYTSVADAVADCTLVVGTTAVRHRDLQHSLRRLEPGTRAIRKHLAASPVAILFGSEKFGLSNEDLSHCHWLLNIPTSEKNISLNLGQAVAVCLYELIRDQKAAGGQSEKVTVASADELERITTLLLEVLRESGYIDLRRVADVDERIRRLVRRLKLPDRDSELWLGMLRQILWKMKSGEHSPK
ncbi:MAG: TrmJ/YjtD family RNA methyltransferase [Candidatus Acidiferrales bacterium]